METAVPTESWVLRGDGFEFRCRQDERGRWYGDGFVIALAHEASLLFASREAFDIRTLIPQVEGRVIATHVKAAGRTHLCLTFETVGPFRRV